LDLVLLRYAHEINGFTELFLTKLDVLSGLEEINVCTNYTRRGKILDTLDFSGDARLLKECEPVYQSLPGWKEDLRQIRKWEHLPLNARSYIEYIEQQIGLPIRSISVGPERSALVDK
jgi:adenylosuccinate synthase